MQTRLRFGTRCIPIKSLGIFKNKKLRGRLKAAVPRDEVELAEVISKTSAEGEGPHPQTQSPMLKVRAFQKRCNTPPRRDCTRSASQSEPSDAQRLPSCRTTVEPPKIEPSPRRKNSEDNRATSEPSLEEADECRSEWSNTTYRRQPSRPTWSRLPEHKHSKTTDRV